MKNSLLLDAPDWPLMLQVRLAVRPVSWLLAWFSAHTHFFWDHIYPHRYHLSAKIHPISFDRFDQGRSLDSQVAMMTVPSGFSASTSGGSCNFSNLAGPTFQGFLNVQADETSYSFHVKAAKTDETSAQNQRLPHVWQKICWVLWVVIEPQCSARCGAALSHRCQSTASGLEESVWCPVKVSTCFNIQQVPTNQSSEVHLLSCVWSLSWISRLQKYHSKHKYICGDKCHRHWLWHREKKTVGPTEHLLEVMEVVVTSECRIQNQTSRLEISHQIRPRKMENLRMQTTWNT